MPAAVRTASWPAPEIWKKILFCRLSWISLSSSLRDSNMVRYADSNSVFGRPALDLRSAFAWVAMAKKITRGADVVSAARGDRGLFVVALAMRHAGSTPTSIHHVFARPRLHLL